MPTKIKDITLYSVTELSQKLNVTPVTIWKYLKQGRLKGQKTMGKWFISGEELIDFFNDSNQKKSCKSADLIQKEFIEVLIQN